jgi:hypothetical protein
MGTIKYIREFAIRATAPSAPFLRWQTAETSLLAAEQSHKVFVAGKQLKNQAALHAGRISNAQEPVGAVFTKW